AEHRALLRAACEGAGGRVVDTPGDACFVAFAHATDAVTAAVAAQRALAAQAWPGGAAIRVRIGLHSGEPTRAPGRQLGLDARRAARLWAAGHGGQVLLSESTRALAEPRLPAGVTVRALGAHRLKDIPGAEPLYQLVIPGLPAEFPALRT